MLTRNGGTLVTSMRPLPRSIAATLVAAAAGACGDNRPAEPDASAGAGDLPDPADLPILDAPPDPFVTFTGAPITTPAQWAAVRRPELERLFRHYVYGFAPPAPGNTTVTELAAADLAGGVSYREYEVRFGPAATPPLHLAVFRPTAATAPVPVFLILNACGNHTVSAAPEVRTSTAWSDSGCDPARGSQADRFAIDAIIGRGAALATFHQSDVALDDPRDELTSGVFAHFTVDAPAKARWGTLAAWSFGMSRAIDALLTRPELDGARIATVGHSRRGKVALLTAAVDDRVAMALPHQSGTGGATLTRSDLGEPVWSINLAFPHWFDDHYVGFGDEERRLPVDQHLLIALVAPRPVLISNGADDTWADPPGALRAAELADPVYELLGRPGLVTDGAGAIDPTGDLVWHQRDGGHALEGRDWITFLDFAAAHW